MLEFYTKWTHFPTILILAKYIIEFKVQLTSQQIVKWVVFISIFIRGKVVMDIYVIHWRWFFELCSRSCDWSKLCHCHFFGPINRIYVKIPMTTSVHYLSFLYILQILYFKWSDILDHFSTFQNMCKYMYHIFTESKVIEDM